MVSLDPVRLLEIDACTCGAGRVGAAEGSVAGGVGGGGRSESAGSATTQGGEARGMSSARCIGWVTPAYRCRRSPSWLDRPSVHVRLAPVDDSWDAPEVFRGAERFFEYRGIPNYGTSATTDTVQSLKWSLRGSGPAGPLRTRSVRVACLCHSLGAHTRRKRRCKLHSKCSKCSKTLPTLLARAHYVSPNLARCRSFLAGL